MGRFYKCYLGLRAIIYMYILGIFYTIVEFLYDNFIQKVIVW